MTKRKKRPYDPASAAKAALERFENENEITRLQTQGAVVKLDERRRIISAYRSNVFNLLLNNKAISQNQHDAAARLAQDWAEWKGLDGGADGPGGGQGCAELVSDRMIKAGDRVGDALGQVGPMDRDLLRSFMAETVENDRAMVWRAIVQKVCGETRDKEQRMLVVSALENLRRAYEEARRPLDVAPRRKLSAAC